MRQAAFFSDNNFQQLTIILSNNYYWNQFLEIIGNPSAGRSQLLSEKNAACRII